MRRFLSCAIAAALCGLSGVTSVIADVVINEIKAESSLRLLRYHENGSQSVGAGAPWWSPEFDDSSWREGPLPAGHGNDSVATDLKEEMRGRAYSLYVRKSFGADASAVAASKLTLNLNVNGQPVQIDIEPTTLLVELLRNSLKLTGTHVGCDTAQCGACTVLLDDSPVKSCSMLALQAQGVRVTTVEGLGGAGGKPHPLQEAFMACHGLQCGFCTPGMLMAACGLLRQTPQPSEAQIVEALEGNLCRCTGYVNIVAAVQQAAQELAGPGSRA